MRYRDTYLATYTNATRHHPLTTHSPPIPTSTYLLTYLGSLHILALSFFKAPIPLSHERSAAMPMQLSCMAFENRLWLAEGCRETSWLRNIPT